MEELGGNQLDDAPLPVFCTNLKCGFLWRTKNKNRVQKCYKCRSRGVFHLENPSANDNKSKPKEKPNPEKVRTEKLANLKKRLESDTDKDNFRLSTFERKTLNQRIRHLESSKIFAGYSCSKCGDTWTSAHGWTGFTQKCAHCGVLAMSLGEISLTEEEVYAKMQRSFKRMTRYSRAGGIFGHDPRRCEMCGIIVRSGHDVDCIKKKWVKLTPDGTTYRILQSS